MALEQVATSLVGMTKCKRSLSWSESPGDCHDNQLGNGNWLHSTQDMDGREAMKHILDCR